METPSPAEHKKLYGATLDPTVLNMIGSVLKTQYAALVEAPLPQRFLDLLAQLEKEERQERSKL